MTRSFTFLLLSLFVFSVSAAEQWTKCSNGMLWIDDEAQVINAKVIAKFPELEGARR